MQAPPRSWPANTAATGLFCLADPVKGTFHVLGGPAEEDQHFIAHVGCNGIGVADAAGRIDQNELNIVLVIK